ncbi:MAG: hypothetical protein GX335_01950 [Firmicutes bacterium]|nr:hypothetical protein [Bacillota bacterium]
MKIGMRNFKTSLSVALCILILGIIGIKQPFFACMTAVFTMQANVSTSFKAGLNRFLGTLAGAVIGTAFAALGTRWPLESFLLKALVIPLGLMFIIYLLNQLKLRDSIFIAGIVYFDLMLRVDPALLSHYAVSRTSLTAFGAVVALLVNRYVFPPETELRRKKPGQFSTQ